MALVCPVGHPDDPDHAFCPLCGRTKLLVDDPEPVAVTPERIEPESWFPEPPMSTLPSMQLARAAELASLQVPQQLSAPAAVTTPLYEPLAPEWQAVAPEPVLAHALSEPVHTQASSGPVHAGASAEPVAADASAEPVPEGDAPAKAPRAVPFAGVAAALAAQPVAGAALSFLGGAVVAGSAVYALT